MNKILYKLFFVGVFLCVGMGYANAQEMVFLKTEQGVFLRYKLYERSEREIFWSKVVDILRSGETVGIIHTANLIEKEGVFASKNGRGKWVKYVRYKPLEKQYFYGNTTEAMAQTYNEEHVKDFVFSLESVPFTVKKPLKVAHLYEMRVRLKAKTVQAEKGFWLLRPFKKLLIPTLTRQFTYVAR